MNDPEGLAGHLDGATHRLRLRIYYEDTDAGGIVYHAGYLRFMERGRTDFLRLVGIRQSELARGPDPLLFAVRHMELDFLAPARLDDVVEVATRVAGVTGARLVLEQAVRRGDDVLVAGRVTVAAIGAGGRPKRLPAAVRERLGAVSAP